MLNEKSNSILEENKFSFSQCFLHTYIVCVCTYTYVHIHSSTDETIRFWDYYVVFKSAAD